MLFRPPPVFGRPTARDCIDTHSVPSVFLPHCWAPCVSDIPVAPGCCPSVLVLVTICSTVFRHRVPSFRSSGLPLFSKLGQFRKRHTRSLQDLFTSLPSSSVFQSLSHQTQRTSSCGLCPSLTSLDRIAMPLIITDHRPFRLSVECFGTSQIASPHQNISPSQFHHNQLQCAHHKPY